MTATRQPAPLSVEDYLALEQTSELRHELIGGVMRARVGSTDTHNLIAGGLEFILRLHLQDTGCRVFRETHKLRVADAVFYPDVFVVRDRNDTDSLYKTQPVLIAEVLSDSTARRDRHIKLAAYRTLPSLESHLILSQTALEVEFYNRTGGWGRKRLHGPDAVVPVERLGLELPLRAIYRDVLEDLNN